MMVNRADRLYTVAKNAVRLFASETMEATTRDLWKYINDPVDQGRCRPVEVLIQR